MIKETTSYEVVCDHCGRQLELDMEFHWRSLDDAYDAMSECGWKERKDGYIYCDECLEILDEISANFD